MTQAAAIPSQRPQLDLIPYDPMHRMVLEMQLSDKAVTDWLPFSHPLLKEEIDQMLSGAGADGRGGFHLWLAEDIANPDQGFVGAIGMQATGYNHLGQCFYWVLPEHQRKGYATEMLSLVKETLLDQWGYKRVQALVAPDNAPSIRVLEKVGFSREGLLRDYFMASFADPNDVMDVYMYACVKEKI